MLSPTQPSASMNAIPEVMMSNASLHALQSHLATMDRTMIASRAAIRHATSFQTESSFEMLSGLQQMGTIYKVMESQGLVTPEIEHIVQGQIHAYVRDCGHIADSVRERLIIESERAADDAGSLVRRLIDMLGLEVPS